MQFLLRGLHQLTEDCLMNKTQYSTLKVDAFPVLEACDCEPWVISKLSVPCRWLESVFILVAMTIVTIAADSHTVMLVSHASKTDYQFTSVHVMQRSYQLSHHDSFDCWQLWSHKYFGMISFSISWLQSFYNSVISLPIKKKKTLELNPLVFSSGTIMCFWSQGERKATLKVSEISMWPD